MILDVHHCRNRGFSAGAARVMRMLAALQLNDVVPDRSHVMNGCYQ